MSRREAEQLDPEPRRLDRRRRRRRHRVGRRRRRIARRRAALGVRTSLDDAARSAWQEGRLQFVRESELWDAARAGRRGTGQCKRLYTPVMLAELVRGPVRAVRHWHRKGHLDADREVGRLPYFDFEQVRVAQRLAELLSAGCSLSQIDRKLDELAHSLPGAARPLADASVVVVGRRLYVRRGDNLTEPSGQLLIDFDESESASSGPCTDAAAATIPITGTTAGREQIGGIPPNWRPRLARTICARWPTISRRAARRSGRSRSIARS